MDSWESKGTLPPPPLEKGPKKRWASLIPDVIKAGYFRAGGVGLPVDSHRFTLLVTERTEGSELPGKREREQLPLPREHIVGTDIRLDWRMAGSSLDCENLGGRDEGCFEPRTTA